jgi:hypothetical protein
MKISELLSEQTVGTIGSSPSPAPTVGTVSNVPSDKPGTATSTAPNKLPGQTDPATDPNLQKLAATLKQNKVVDNEKDINDFMGAYQAQQSGKTLNPMQQASMANLASAMLKNKSLATNLDLQLKATAQQKPGTAPVQKAPGGM